MSRDLPAGTYEIYSDGSFEATTNRVMDAGSDDDERRVEAALRPRRLADYAGQTRVRDQLGLVLEAARVAERPRTTCCSPGRPGSARPPWP